jgi:hypothetical protein
LWGREGLQLNLSHPQIKQFDVVTEREEEESDCKDLAANENINQYRHTKGTISYNKSPDH